MARLTKEEKSKFEHWNYAHRGLHTPDRSVPENSLPAFQAAVDAGYGAELDVQLTKDGQVVVFHDDDMKRVCGVDARVGDFTYEELQQFPLFDTEYRIPLFTDVLKIMGTGRGPLIVELKYSRTIDALCSTTYEILKTYKGVYCIESFDPRIVIWFRKNAPEIVRGQLATNIPDYGEYMNKVVAFLLSRCFWNFSARPDFIAYNRSVKTPRRVLRAHKKGTMLFAWTSREPNVDQKNYDGVIFEFYRPSANY